MFKPKPNLHEQKWIKQKKKKTFPNVYIYHFCVCEVTRTIPTLYHPILKWFVYVLEILFSYFFFINMDVQVNLCASRLTTRTLKLTTI